MKKKSVKPDNQREAPLSITLGSNGADVHLQIIIKDPLLHNILNKMPAEERIEFVTQLLHFGAIVAENEGRLERLEEVKGHTIILQVKPKEKFPDEIYR